MQLSYGSFVTVKSNRKQPDGSVVNGNARRTNLSRVEMLSNKKKQNLRSHIYSQNTLKSLRNADSAEKDSRKAQKIEEEIKLSKKELKAKRKQLQKSVKKTKHSIGGTLIGIISSLVIASMGLITFLVSYFISDDTRTNAEENNLTINIRTASETENRFTGIISSVGMLFDSIEKDSEDELAINDIVYKFFERNTDIIAIAFMNQKKSFANRQFFAVHDIPTLMFDSYLAQEIENIEKVENGLIQYENTSPFFNIPSLAIFAPVTTDNVKDKLVVLYSTEDMTQAISAGSVNLSYIVNRDGKVLVHPDISVTKSGSDYSTKYMVKQMFASSQTGEQIKFTDDDGTEYYGAYSKISNGACGIITEVQTSVVLQAVNATTRRNIYLTIAIVAIAILIVWFFSKSLSSPLKDLTAVTNEINQGNFDTDLFDVLDSKRKDEIGVLIESTKAEREILNTFTKLTNKGVTRAIVRKEIDFEPHLKDITIFFSDIRGFTAISDGFNKRFGEKSAGEIISFLNDYMARMVNCITITGGNVDKFEGDAIMACWGVLRDDNLDFELLPDSDPRKKSLKAEHDRHVKSDAVSAVKAAIGMRYSLMEYNKAAEKFTEQHANEPNAKYKPHIRIGSGLNSGRATVGFMGSNDKMEFTSIGDAVNLASRTESSNKPCGTDMLLTEDTYNLLKMDYIRCPENNYTIKPENIKDEIIVEVIPVTFEVKGKGAQHFYGVVNMPNFNIEEFFKTTDPDFKVDEDCAKAVGPLGPKTLNEVRELLGIPIPDFSGVNLDAEESKVQAK